MRILVVGTGTDVGKTHVSQCLLAHLVARGLRVGAYKPVATAVVERCEDAESHALSLGAEVVPATYAYRAGVSPHLAARMEDRPIDLDVIAARARELSVEVDVLLIEGAGGLFSPLGDAITNADLVLSLLPAEVVLVASDRLGVLHDVRACSLGARALGVPISTVALSAPAMPDASTGTNAAELDRLGLGKVGGVFPRAVYDARESQGASSELLSTLGFRK